jgi:hypothetical protein
MVRSLLPMRARNHSLEKNARAKLLNQVQLAKQVNSDEHYPKD